MNYRFVSQTLNRSENRYGLYLTAAMVAFLLMALAAIYVTPALETSNHGTGYQQLSDTPFDFDSSNPLKFRILTPLLAHILFFRGERYIFFPLLISVFFLMSVYIHFRREDFTPSESLGTTVLMAFSTTILFTLHFQGYTDTTSYLLIWLCLIVKAPPLRALFFTLALLNHESNAFCFPFLVYRPWEADFSWRRALSNGFWLSLSFIPILVFRWYVTSQTEVALSSSFYLNPQRIKTVVWRVGRLLPIGVFEAFRLFWIIPISAAGILWKHKKHPQACWIGLVVLCVGLQLLLASDTSRLIGLAFPAVLFGAKVLREHLKIISFERLLWLLILLNFIVPVYYVGQQSMYPLYPLPVSLILQALGVDAWHLWWR